ncbi:prepilin-type N-terminal cleavage/methylation domain-containing protein [Massilia phosphatilytica]
MIARRQRGMALIEAIVAALLLAIGLLGAIGLQARSMSALADAGMRAEATIAADKLLGTMAVDLPNAGDYALDAGGTPTARLQAWYDETRARIPNAAIAVAVTPATSRTRVEITISWTRKTGAAQNAHRVVAYLAAAT